MLKQRKSLLVRWVAGAAAIMLSLSACSADGGKDKAKDSGDAKAVTISAAASMTDVLKDLEKEYAKEHDGFSLKANLGASSKLVQQINEGQKSELLITADEEAIKNLDSSTKYHNKGRVVTNKLVLAVSKKWMEKQDPTQAKDVSYILKNAKVALCAADVPCGRNTKKWLEEHPQEGFQATTEEDNVRNTLTKVVNGEVDAAFVYATDQATASDTTEAVELPGAHVQGYPLLVSPDASDAAKSFAEWLQQEKAQKILTDAGFGPGEKK